MNRIASSALVIALASALPACESVFSAGGDTFSNDHFTYESTTWVPKSVELIDTRNGQVLWALDIPVGQKVTMKFEPERGDRDETYPDRMTWVVQRLDSDSWRGAQDMLVPGPSSRLVTFDVRPAPEYPEQTASYEEPPALEPEAAPDANGLDTGG